MENIDSKKIAAEKAVEFIQPGMVISLGTGSTVFWAIQKLGELVKQGLKIKTVSTSVQSEKLAKELNIPAIALDKVKRIDIAIDGADEVDGKFNLIKGGGGALLREKILASNSEQFIVIVDQSKMVSMLGKFPLPVEVAPFASSLTFSRLEKLGCSPKVRTSEQQPFITDNGNLIIDCQFEKIPDPASLNIAIHLIPGVLETGLFIHDMVHKVIVGGATGEVLVLDN